MVNNLSFVSSDIFPYVILNLNEIRVF